MRPWSNRGDDWVKAASTEPALVIQQPGPAGLGTGLPAPPFLLAVRQLKLCVMGRGAGQRKEGAGVMGAAPPALKVSVTLQAHAQGRAVWEELPGRGTQLACSANQLLAFLQDRGDSVPAPGHLGRNSGHGVILGQFRGQQRRDGTPSLPVGLARSPLSSERRP